MKNGTWLVVLLLALGACKDKKAGDGAGATIAKMTELKDKMCACKDAKCAQDVSDEMTRWSQEQAKNQKEPAKPSEADTKKVAAIGEELGKCMQAAMAATATPPAGEGTPPAGSDTAAAGSAAPAGPEGLPAECAEYKAQVEKLKTCDKIPAKARDALIKAFDDASAGWANMPEGAKAGLDTSCKAGAQAVVDAAKDACGW